MFALESTTQHRESDLWHIWSAGEEREREEGRYASEKWTLEVMAEALAALEAAATQLQVREGGVGDPAAAREPTLIDTGCVFS